MAKDKSAVKMIALAGVAVGGYILYQKLLAAKNVENASSSTLPAGASVVIPGSATVPPVTISSSSNQHTGYPLTYGHYNEDAKLLQQNLGLTADGMIGPQSLAAIRKYIPSFPQNFQIESYDHLTHFIAALNQIKSGNSNTDVFKYV